MTYVECVLDASEDAYSKTTGHFSIFALCLKNIENALRNSLKYSFSRKKRGLIIETLIYRIFFTPLVITFSTISNNIQQNM